MRTPSSYNESAKNGIFNVMFQVHIIIKLLLTHGIMNFLGILDADVMLHFVMIIKKT